jgi:hypothetical protein
MVDIVVTNDRSFLEKTYLVCVWEVFDIRELSCQQIFDFCLLMAFFYLQVGLLAFVFMRQLLFEFEDTFSHDVNVFDRLTFGENDLIVGILYTSHIP